MRVSAADGGALGARAVLGGAMVWAGLEKLADPQSFAMVVRRYEVLPGGLAAPWAAVLPGVEVAAGACLLAGLWVRGAALVVLGLLGSFAVALGVNVARGVDMSCGCFGLEAAGHSLPVALAADVVLGAVAAGLVKGTIGAVTSSPGSFRAGPGGYPTGAQVSNSLPDASLEGCRRRPPE